MVDSGTNLLGLRSMETMADCCLCFETWSAVRTLARGFLPAKGRMRLPTGLLALVLGSGSGSGSDLYPGSALGPVPDLVVAGLGPRVALGVVVLALLLDAASESHLYWLSPALEGS